MEETWYLEGNPQGFGKFQTPHPHFFDTPDFWKGAGVEHKNE